jgi:hypothetical protein
LRDVELVGGRIESAGAGDGMEGAQRGVTHR